MHCSVLSVLVAVGMLVIHVAVLVRMRMRLVRMRLVLRRLVRRRPVRMRLLVLMIVRIMSAHDRAALVSLVVI